MIRRWLPYCIWVAIAILVFCLLTPPVIEGASGDTDEKITPTQAFILCSVISRMIYENTIDNNPFYNSILRNIGITDPAFTKIIDIDNTNIRGIIGMLNAVKGSFPPLPGGFVYPSIVIPVPPPPPAPKPKQQSFFKKMVKKIRKFRW